ncbi:unnamed protein product [Boreogadus saida]
MDEGPVGVLPSQPSPGGLPPPGPLHGFPPPPTPLEIQASRAHARARTLAWDVPAGPAAEPPQWAHCGGPLGALLWSRNGCAGAGAADRSPHSSPRSEGVCGSDGTVKPTPENGDMLSPERGPGARPASGPEPENVEDRGPVRTSNPSPLPGPGGPQQGPPTATTPPPPGSRSESRAGSAGGDHLRVVKHKPSFIVFRDFDADGARRPGRVVRRAESDAGGSSASSSSSATTEEEEDCRDDQEKAEEADLIPELSQYEGFPVSRCRRNLATSRKCLRRRRDVPVIGSADPVAAAVSADSEEEEEEEEEGAKNNNEQVGPGDAPAVHLRRKLAQLNQEVQEVCITSSAHEDVLVADPVTPDPSVSPPLIFLSLSVWGVASRHRRGNPGEERAESR